MKINCSMHRSTIGPIVGRHSRGVLFWFITFLSYNLMSVMSKIGGEGVPLNEQVYYYSACGANLSAIRVQRTSRWKSNIDQMTRRTKLKCCTY